MKIAIIDDQKEDRDFLSDSLARFFHEIGRSYELSAFESAEAFFNSYQHDFRFAIFDIDMPGMNGIEAARKLRAYDEDIVLMFITNMPQYALDGYRVDAIDYILKPVNYPDFRLKMQKALRFIERNQDPQIGINTIDGYLCLPVSSIYYIESQLHYVQYHTKNGVFKTRDTLNHAENKLSQYHFVRSSTSYLVNLRHLQSMHGSEIQVGPDTLQISRGKKTSFLSEFTKYMGGISQ